MNTWTRGGEINHDKGGGWISRGIGGSKWALVGYVVNAAALWVRIQTSLKNYKWATESRGVANTRLPAKNILKRNWQTVF
jgi:hypothetical protein